MPKNSDSSKYLQLHHSRAYQRHRFEEIQHGRTFVDRHYYRVLIEGMVSEKARNLEKVVAKPKSLLGQNHTLIEATRISNV